MWTPAFPWSLHPAKSHWVGVETMLRTATQTHEGVRQKGWKDSVSLTNAWIKLNEAIKLHSLGKEAADEGNFDRSRKKETYKYTSLAPLNARQSNRATTEKTDSDMGKQFH